MMVAVRDPLRQQHVQEALGKPLWGIGCHAAECVERLICSGQGFRLFAISVLVLVLTGPLEDSRFIRRQHLMC